jgi:hypothetical protein
MTISLFMDHRAAVSATEYPAAARFALIISQLMAAIALRRGDPDVWTGDMIFYVRYRLRRINQVFQTLAALIAAAKLPKEREYKPRAPKDPMFGPPPPPDPDVKPKRPVGPTKPKPGIWKAFRQERFAWLCGLMPPRYFLPGAGAYAGYLRMLMDDPEMKALVAASSRMQRLLRPLFWMLGIEASLLGEPPPKRPRRKRAPRSRAPHPPRPAREPTNAEIMKVINDRPWPKNGRGGPPFLPGESPRRGFPARTVRGWGGKPPDFSKTG